MKKPRAFSAHSKLAMLLMAEQIKLGRKQRGWSEQNLADRANISRATLHKIEEGNPGCAVGLVFEVATLVGIPLFESDTSPLRKQLGDAEQKTALLPKRTYPQKKAIDDAF